MTGSEHRAAGPVVLALETAGSRCSVAVARGDEIIAAESRALRHGHAEALLPMIDRVMAAAGLPPHALDLVAAATGPGGFTGIRVGLAAASGIALATGARLIGVTAFDAVAHALARAGNPGSAALLIALDSRREDFYVQLFASADPVPLAEPEAVLPDRLHEYLGMAAAAPVLIAGDAAANAAEALRGRIDFDLIPDSAPDAVGVVAAALSAGRAGLAARPARPFYLRPPDVTLPKPRPSFATGLR